MVIKKKKTPTKKKPTKPVVEETKIIKKTVTKPKKKKTVKLKPPPNPKWRPTKFKVELIQKIKEYFHVPSNYMKEITTTWKNDYEKIEYKEFANNLPTIQWFCADNWITKQILHNWLDEARSWVKIKMKWWETYIRKDPNKIIFLDAYMCAKEFQERIWIENSLKWLYNAQFAIFMWKNVFDWKDKTEVDNNHSWELTIVWAMMMKRKKQKDETRS